ncbi:uncharacterized protein KY384_003662 [Bacidia gigantensis]|uniref:uncharacterized protein n=1 Tax=Bacidia gigantensis TaxID=2732470 RepID=UPI001D0387E7|nr:uncharacterized protein KY384_003662 [Bacidia gigantensis]KAG8532026.1 hypothetical protein KY384_003662 [Bacidia gigantensis]
MDQDPHRPGQQQPGAAMYDTSVGGHYGASAQVSQGLTDQYRDILTTYWQQTIHQLENENHDYKIHQLPLARIKKVMKADPDVKMISAEAPILFAKGCDIFITELTMRAWIHAEENKRRTLQRSDIASALAKSDMFDFLIDIVPREEAASHGSKRSQGGQSAANAGSAPQQTQAGMPGQMPTPNNVAQPPQSGQPPQDPQHHMNPSDYQMQNNQMPDQGYRAPPTMYPPQMPQDPNQYPQQQMFEQNVYGYNPMAAQQQQQQMYGVGQRPQDPSAGEGPTHQYQRHDGGAEGDADAEGERDYEVG